MVNGTRLNAGEMAVTRVTGVTRPAAVATASQAATTPARPEGDLRDVSNLARTLAAQPPVNQDRIAEIKKAIADGNFPILPATIADQMIALKLNWNGK
jgi:negative regulator of flagellin synthesis FlgM